MATEPVPTAVSDAPRFDQPVLLLRGGRAIVEGLAFPLGEPQGTALRATLARVRGEHRQLVVASMSPMVFDDLDWIRAIARDAGYENVRFALVDDLGGELREWTEAGGRGGK